MANYRIGHGYDAHCLIPGRRLILGGVHIPFDKGLLGHSDADILTHAAMDSLLGALSLGDIGKLFPDTDDTYKNASSVGLLWQVAALVREHGFEISNLDATIVAQDPKLSPYIEEMRKNLAEAMGIEFEQVGVKATTEEGLGFTGEGIGMAAHCMALLEKAAL